MSEARSDQPLWQHFSNGKWHSFGEISTVLELEFRSNSSYGPNITGEVCQDVDSSAPIPRVSTVTGLKDAAGNLLTLTDPVANTTSWVYDALHRVTEEEKDEVKFWAGRKEL